MRRLMMILLVIYAFAVPWEYSLDLGEPLGNVARVAGLLLLVAAVPVLLASGEIRRPGGAGWLVLALYLFFAMSCLWSADQDASLEKLRSYFQVMMIVWLVWEFATEPRHLQLLMRGFVGGCWVLAVLTVIDFLSSNGSAVGQIRFVAEGQDPNDVARFLDLGFPLAALLFATETGWVIRIAAIAYLPGGLLAVLLTASRGGFSASVAAMAGSALLLARWRPRAMLWAGAGLAVVVAGVLAIVPSESFDRLATIPEQLGSSDLNDRFSIWVSGWQAFTRAPWLGSGAGSFIAAAGVAPGDTAHNTAVAILVTGGLVGFALVAAIWLVVVIAILQTPGLLRIALASAMLVWTITSMVGSVEENRTTWLLFAIMATAGRINRDDNSGTARMYSAVGYSRDSDHALIGRATASG